jgi:hypothetical protein
MTQNKTKLYAGLVWILSGTALLIYGILGLTQTDMLGAEQLITFVNSADGIYLYLAAFISILLEGLYFIGSFFPGSSIVLLLAILAQTGGSLQFLLVIMTVFLGWTLAGVLNIFGATYFSHLFKIKTTTTDVIKQDAEITWFPAFRSNSEVAQITEGHSMRKVFLSSTLIKLYASAGVAVYALVLPFIINIQELSNEEGFIGLGIIALINFVVGGMKIYEYKVGTSVATHTPS